MRTPDNALTSGTGGGPRTQGQGRAREALTAPADIGVGGCRRREDRCGRPVDPLREPDTRAELARFFLPARHAGHRGGCPGRVELWRRDTEISEQFRHLRAVDHNGEIEPDTVVSLKAEIHRLGAVVKGLERDIRGWMVRYRLLEEDKAAEAREHPLWPVAGMLFGAWRRRCNHPRSPFTTDRFWLIEAFLTNPKYGPTLEARVMLCARAIGGASFDPFTVQRKNGSTKRFDAWERIFGAPDRWRKTAPSAGSFEEFCNRAPRGWVPTLSPDLVEAISVAEARLASLREAAKA